LLQHDHEECPEVCHQLYEAVVECCGTNTDTCAITGPGDVTDDIPCTKNLEDFTDFIPNFPDECLHDHDQDGSSSMASATAAAMLVGGALFA
jgi:hypothetical protein